MKKLGLYNSTDMLRLQILLSVLSISLFGQGLNDGEAHGDAPFLVEDGWRPLLNGKDMGGWAGQDGKPSEWLTVSGVVWERLTTASLGSMDFLFVTYEVGGASSSEDALHRQPILEGRSLGHDWTASRERFDHRLSQMVEST